MSAEQFGGVLLKSSSRNNFSMLKFETNMLTINLSKALKKIQNKQSINQLFTILLVQHTDRLEL